MGEAEVTKALEIIHEEVDLTMALCGHTDIRRVDDSILLECIRYHADPHQ